MSDDFIPDPIKSYNPRKPVITPVAQNNAAAPVDMDDAAIRKMCRNELVISLKANSGKPVVANLVNALLDRIDGKPAQSVSLAVKGDVQHTHNVELSAELLKEQIGRILHKKPITIEN